MTEKQVNALEEFIRRVIADERRGSDVFEAVQLRKAREALVAAFAQDEGE